ncbi:MAG TPA: DUF1223 domain-containing protein [Blastocatellia bacterium]
MKYKILLASSIFAAAFLIAALINRKVDTSMALEADALSPVEGRKAVLVELFTSEGCSSCPPADRLLSELVQSQMVAGAEVIALSEHVDYWNRLGWADPFSSSAFSERQRIYSQVFENDSVYTPQMIVDGREEFVGSNAARARNAIAQAARTAKATVTLSALPSEANRAAIKIHIENLPAATEGDKVEVILAITESELQSNVTRGENTGRKLAHTAVTRKMESIGSLQQGDSFDREAAVDIDKGWNRDHLRAVVFLQERRSRRVLGAAAISLARKP